MPIYLGTNKMGDLSIGSNKIGSAYIGSNLVFSSVKIASLGTSTSFNIKNSYPSLYSSLTADNFFFRTASTASGSTGITMRPTWDREWSGFSGGITKTYDASTGVLTLNTYCSPGNTASVSAVLVSKPSILVDLGTATSFNVSNQSGYQNFTADNFLIHSAARAVSHGNMYYPQSYEYADYGSCNVTIEKSYNASTGVLSCYLHLNSWDTGGVYDYYNGSDSAALHVFLLK